MLTIILSILFIAFAGGFLILGYRHLERLGELEMEMDTLAANAYHFFLFMFGMAAGTLCLFYAASPFIIPGTN